MPPDFAELDNIVTWAMRTCRVPHFLLQDARQEAWIGLLAALSRYDGRCELKTYGEPRARGAVQDFLRRQDPLNRSQRKAVRAGAEPDPVHVTLQAWHGTTAAETPDASIDIDHLLGRYLTPREQFVVRARLRELPWKKAGKPLGVGAARAYQIYCRALATLRAAVTPI